MNWTYDDVVNLPQHLYEVLVEMLKREAEELERRKP
jgi:hypothetical protein